ncbi:hypothetical protein TgHK011_008974 [Trichoderma gracile]|nr:hypothetical protein TgHK011_008974 [Trichoderma gracile]
MLLVRKASAFETQASRIAAPLCGEEPFSSLLGCSLQVTGTCCHRCSPSHPQRSTPARQPEIHLVRANQRARRKAIASQSGLARRAWAPRRQSLAGPALPCEAAGRGSRYRRPPAAKSLLLLLSRERALAKSSDEEPRFLSSPAYGSTSGSTHRSQLSVSFSSLLRFPQRSPHCARYLLRYSPALAASGARTRYPVRRPKVTAPPARPFFPFKHSQHKQRFFFFYFFVLNVFFPFFFLSFTTIYDQAVVVFFRSASFFVPSFSHLGRR